MSGQNSESGSKFHLPQGVSAAFVDHDGNTVYHLDPFLRNMKWEGIQIDSSRFKQLSTHERLYQLAQAYLHAATLLCEAVGEAPENLDWPQASVCYFCSHLATELFLKSCILCIGRDPGKLSHEIADLLRRYREALPEKEFEFLTPWFLSARDLAESLGHEVLQGVDRTPDQLFRYGMDKGGNVSAGVQFFTPGYFFNYAKYLAGKWQDIWTVINEMKNG
jgi:HEPN domain-containing protein